MTPENWDAQLQQIRDIVDEAPGDNDARLMLAHFLTWFDNKPREAIDVLKSALEVDPLNASIHLRLARAYFNVREMPSARDAMRKSIELEPEGPNAYVFLGDILAAMGDNVAMLENYIKAMTLDPTDLAYATAVAENLYMIGLHEKADQFRARVAAVQPNSVYLVGLGFLRAQAAFDEQLANEKARQLIVEQTDNVFYWTAAVVQLLQSAVVHDAVPDTLAFIDEHAPGFSDLQNPQEKSIKEILAQLKCLNAFRQQRSEQEIDRYIEDLLAFAEAINYVIEDHPNTHLDFLLAREDTKGAIALVLSNHLQRQVAMDPLWRLEYAQPRFAKVVADPRVQEALQRREKEEAEYREDVHAMLERLGY